MKDALGLIIAAVRILFQLIRAWFSTRRGRLKMTTPGRIALLNQRPGRRAQVSLCAVLHGAGKRGRIIEAMHLNIRYADSSHLFTEWGHGKAPNWIVEGGLLVDERGCIAALHFWPSRGGTRFQFQPGDLKIEIYARFPGRRSPYLLGTLDLPLSREHASALNEENAVIIFHGAPVAPKYQGFIDTAGDAANLGAVEAPPALPLPPPGPREEEGIV